MRDARRKNEILKGKFVLRRVATVIQDEEEGDNTLGKIIAEAQFAITRRVERRRTSKSSISNILFQHDDADTANGRQESIYVPYVKYGRQPIVLRLVLDTQLYPRDKPFRGDGYRMASYPLPSYVSSYPPPFFVDDVALRHSSQIELAPPPAQLNNNDTHNNNNNNNNNNNTKTQPPFSFQIKLKIISPTRHVIQRQIELALEMAQSVLGADDDILDEIRYLISDENLHRFLITQIITFLHVWLDYLAFREEVGFYVGKKNNLTGLSLSTVITRLLCDIIIFLYLCDGGNTSWLVLSSVGSGVLVELYKASKILHLRFSPRPPFFTYRDPSTYTPLERRTVDYDRVARTYLGLLLYPAVLGCGLYGRTLYEYTGWYSWGISNLANVVYTFGFIALCPQLYVNYRLKSVAHLPWRVFVYKIFSTFVDDVFAFLIRSPLKYKLMTLRDDVVFVVFLVQAYIYRVDKSRANEFGYAYTEEEDKEKVKDKEKEGLNAAIDAGTTESEGRGNGGDGIQTVGTVSIEVGPTKNNSTIVRCTPGGVQDFDKKHTDETKKEK